MSNWRSTVGGACSATGTFLMGIGVVSQFNGASSKIIQDVTLFGFLLMGAGTFFAHLYSADAKTVANLSDLVDAQGQAIKTGNTTFLTKPTASPETPITPKPPG